ncbi:hypothetical protein [Streptomyces sp. NBC_00280]|uniref:hypothetical protein n=1 Tax=Streptomyces sp. NBC_00280 TaxID=2975699 RepID=UPI00352F0E96
MSTVVVRGKAAEERGERLLRPLSGGVKGGGTNWRPARLYDRPRAATWTRWSLGWRPDEPGSTHLLARATDTAGRTQPDIAWPNTQGYLFSGLVRHPVTVV